MRISIDTKEIMSTVRKNVKTFSEKVEANSKPKRTVEESYEYLQDELDYVKLILEWNKKRVLQGKKVFIPKKLSATAQRILKNGINKTQLKQLKEGDANE